MEDHSLSGYLKRRSTKELETILQYCLQGENYIHYAHTIKEILRILQECFVPDITDEAYIWLREKLLQYKPKEEEEDA